MLLDSILMNISSLIMIYEMMIDARLIISLAARNTFDHLVGRLTTETLLLHSFDTLLMKGFLCRRVATGGSLMAVKT